MGLEITKKTELNQYEIINHKSNVRLWLHDVVDGLIVPGLVTAENLIAGVTLGLNELYSASDHKHDDLYSVLAHNHDSDYADIAHNHDDLYSVLAHNHDSDYADLAHNHDDLYSVLAHNHDSDYADIAHNHDDDYSALGHTHSYVPLTYGIGAMQASWMGNGEATRTINLSYSIGVKTPLLIILLSWLSTFSYRLCLWTNSLPAGFLYMLSGGGCAVDASQWTFTAGGTSIDIVANINTSSWYYRLFMLGWRTT